MVKTLKDWLPMSVNEAQSFPNILKHLNTEIKHEYTSTRWPGPQKNVYSFVELATGHFVGFNENPGKGWSFPVVARRK